VQQAQEINDMFDINILSASKGEKQNSKHIKNKKMENNHKEGENHYTKFVLMLLGSFIAMYLTMYLNTYEMSHLYFSLTRFYMACLGISAMAVIMLLFMLNMYRNKKKNIAILLGSLILFVSALTLVRAQTPIGDVLYMKAMIPHHSIAILTSKRADIKDPEVRKLADEIIKAQEKEIVEMKAYINRLQSKR
jgi:uncharacterized protein (DUF305 family)